MFPRPCAEFPNDNPALYGGLMAIRTHASPDTAPEPEESQRPENLESVSLEEEGHWELTSTPAEVEKVEDFDDPFANLVSVLESVARDAGASDGQAAGVRGMLGLERLAIAALPEAAVDALFAGTQLEGTPQAPRRAPAFTATVLAWRAILRGEGEDFAACGSATLDEWAADLLARLLGNPTHASQIRRELRRRGIAAFGLVTEAA